MLYQFLSLSFFRQLCLLLNAEDIYRALSEIIVQEEDLLFASLMVRYLNMILLTSSELFDLRDQLRELATPVSNSQYRMCFDFELRESLSSASSLLGWPQGKQRVLFIFASENVEGREEQRSLFACGVCFSVLCYTFQVKNETNLLS